MVAKGAGDLLRRRFQEMVDGGTIKVQEKGPSDFVTEVDREVEGWIIDQLSMLAPGVPVFSEEHYHGEACPATCWIVDPLDGTRSFIHGIPHFAVTLAYIESGKPLVGVTYAPMEDEFFHAEAGKGFWFNGEKASVSRVGEPSSAVVALGLPYRGREHLSVLLAFYKAAYLKGMALRHTGSAALDLCYVACGRYDALFYMDLSPWDVAAGGLMVEEGGGVVGGLGNKEWLSGWLWVSNAALAPLIGRMVQEILGDLSLG